MRKMSLTCPHCDVFSTFTLRTSYGTNYIFSCDQCGEFIYIVSDKEDEKIIDQYPRKIPKLHKSIPTDVADDYIEAIKCFSIDACKASVAMCRRALQSSVIEKGAKKDKLIDQIDELFDNGLITEDIKNWAHEIRLAGNIGAHPDKDGLKDVTPQDAKEMIDFTEEYLNYVYIMPFKVNEKRVKRKAQK